MARAGPETATEAAGAAGAAEAALARIHATLRLRHGDFSEEVPEQRMAVRFVAPGATVLELGGNVGRNSCVMGRLLTDSARLVVLESDARVAAQLRENRDANGLAFHVEAAALSKRRLAQRGWDTMPLEDGQAPPRHWAPVATVTWAQLREKYPGHAFDTLVADCEGALYYILQDEPEFLGGFRTVLMENDYRSVAHKRFVDAELARSGFRRVYHEPGGWTGRVCPCADCFFECWARDAA